MSNLTGRGPLGLKQPKTPKHRDPHPIRESARGERCTLRLPCCDHLAESVVLCHIRRFGWAGMGQKPHDLLGVYACHNCHAAMDGRSRGGCSDTDILRAHGETVMAMLRSGTILIADTA